MAKSTPKVKVNNGKQATKGYQATNIRELQAIRTAQISKYNNVKNTTSSYRGQEVRGKIFLAKVVEERRTSGPGDSDGIDTEKLALAFDNPPNEYSAFALEMFLVQKCYNEDRKKSTADSIHSAFARYWDTMDGTRYAGEYHLNKETGEVTGCPARAENVRAIVQSIKTRAKSKGESATRNHADAITLEEIKNLMNWSEKQCPNSLLADPQDIKDVKTLKFRLEHGFMRAFISSAFTLWTRCFELLSLQAGDIESDCHGPAPFYIPHFKVHLTNRKGWQHEKGYDGPRTSNIYDIYKQDIPEIDMNTHFTWWKEFLEGHIGTPLKADDYLFPHIGTNGVIRMAEPMSYDGLQLLLTKFCDGAGQGGVVKRYTTHSFRRGGAQYRFMFAPLGQRWSLNRMRWWGGWAIGEHVDTLIKYLVDSLQSFENGHGHALHPVPLEPEASFMGEHTSVKPATCQDFQHFGALIDRKFEGLAAKIQCIQQHPTLSQLSNSCAAASGLIPEQVTPGISHNIINSEASTSTSIQTTSIQFVTTPIFAPSTRKPPLPLPISGVSIPSLGHSPGAWRRAIKQWEEPDPETGISLRDWPSIWYSGAMKPVTGSKRGHRQLVFEEFERLGRDESAFLNLYPDADKSIAELLKAIRSRLNRRRASKNGPPH